MKELVDALLRSGVLRTEHLVAAFRHVDRADFVPEEYEGETYGDYPLPIGYGQTISQPYTVAFMIELLMPKRGECILDVGSGSGWTTALLAHCVGEEGRVIGLEIVPELVEFGRHNLQKYDFRHAEIRHVERGSTPSFDERFDKILVSAAAAELPRPLVDQLKTGGVMVIPVRDAILRVEKVSDTELHTERHEGFSFVPLA